MIWGRAWWPGPVFGGGEFVVAKIAWMQGVLVKRDGHVVGSLSGPRTLLPIAPFPGLVVGWLTVETVFVNQGGVDLESGCLEYEPVDTEQADLLMGWGWEWAETDEPEKPRNKKGERN